MTRRPLAAVALIAACLALPAPPSPTGATPPPARVRSRWTWWTTPAASFPPSSTAGGPSSSACRASATCSGSGTAPGAASRWSPRWTGATSWTAGRPPGRSGLPGRAVRRDDHRRLPAERRGRRRLPLRKREGLLRRAHGRRPRRGRDRRRHLPERVPARRPPLPYATSPWPRRSAPAATRPASRRVRLPPRREARAARRQARPRRRRRALARPGPPRPRHGVRRAARLPVEEVPFERASSHPGAVLTLRYDDRQGLLAAGVDLDRWARSRREEAWRRERADPFRSSGYAEPPPGW